MSAVVPSFMLIKKIPTPHYPTGWIDAAGNGNIARFGARFRAAKAFQGIVFAEGMSKDTGHGYSMMTYTFLAYTAFEAFSRAFGIGADKKRRQIEGQYAKEELYERVRQLSAKNAAGGFLNFVKDADEKLSDECKRNIEATFKDKKQDFLLIPIAEAVRHSFAHGRVTPNAWNSNCESVAELCKLLADLLVEIMDSEYSPRHQGLLKSKKPQ